MSGPRARKRAGDRTVVQERIVARQHEAQVYGSGFGGFTWWHDVSDVEGQGALLDFIGRRSQEQACRVDER